MATSSDKSSDKSVSSGKPPKLRDLISLWLNDWYKVGKKLDVNESILNRLEKDHGNNIPECKKRMFGVWLRTHQNRSYEVVMQALLDAGESRAAEELHQKHGISLSKLLQSRETESYQQLSQVSLVFSGPDKKTKQSVKNVVSEYIKERESARLIKWRMKMSRIRPYLRKNDWFNIAVLECVKDDFPQIGRYCYIDLGELLEVNELGPLLLNVKSTQFVCLDARENFAKPVQQGKETATTVGDIVHQALHTVGSIWNTVSQVTRRAFGSIVIGKFSANDSEETVASVNSALKSSLEECGCCQGKEIKYRHFRRGNLIFPLAEKSPEHDEHIKSVIREVDAYHGWRVNVKSSVYKFCCLCCSRGGILKVSDCESFMKVCGISSDKFPRMLHSIHYHCGLILHYADIPSMKDLVICDPQIVIDGLIQLITVINGLKNSVRKTGEVSEGTLKNACFVAKDSLSIFQIINLLQYYHISSKIRQNIYFLPFLLPFDPLVNQSASLIFNTLYPVPIAIHFLNSQVPAGIFYALVCQLSKSWRLTNQQRYKNRITLLIENAISCTLLNHTAFIEVRVDGASRSTPLVLFRYVMQEISEILSYVIGFFQHTENLEFKIAFFCPNSTNHSLHIAEINKEDQLQIKCQNILCQEEVIPIEENFTPWLTCENEEGSSFFGQSTSWKTIHGENEKILELIQEHIDQEGSINLRVVKSLFFGPPCVGKTTTRKRITGEIENLSTSAPPTSTGIDNPITVSLYHETESTSVLIGDNMDQWKEQDIESQADMLINCLLRADKNPPEPITSAASPFISRSNISHKLQQSSIESMETSTKPTIPIVNSTMSNSQYNLQQEKESSLDAVIHSSLVSQSERLYSEPDSVPFFIRMVRERKWKELEDFFQNMQDFTLLQMIDIGGQPEFQEILPLLMSGPALYLMFINITQDLHKRYEVIYTHEDHRLSSITYRSHLTNEEILLQILTTIASMNAGNKQNSLALLLGTYSDQATKEMLANLEDCIYKSEIHSFIERGVLRRIPLEGVSKCIFPLDNKNGERREMSILQKQLGTHIQDNFHPQPLPTSWVFFHLALRNRYENMTGYCSLEDAIDVGSTYGISRQNINNVLSIIHRQFGTILFYPEIPSLAKLVICNPNVIFKPISNLIAIAFGENKHAPLLAEQIRSSGQFSTDLIEGMMEPLNRHCSVPSNAIIDLMKHHYIISEVFSPHGNVVYFMPSLLRPEPCVGKETRKTLEKFEPSPLLLRFRDGYIPIGLFASLIVQLSTKWTLKDQQQYKNHISLIADRKTLTEIDIIQHANILEVHVDCDSISEAQKVCTNALKLIDQAISDIKSSHEYMKNTRHDFGFYCPHSLQGSDKPHFAACLDIEKPENMLCTNTPPCQKKRFPLLQKHKIWFPGHEDPVEEMELGSPQDLPPQKNYRQEVETMIKEKQISSDKIDRGNHSSQLMIDLPRELHPIWYPLGFSLDVHLTELNIINKDHPNDCQSCFMAMLNAWLKTGNASWLSLVQSLNRESLGNYSEIAYNIAMNHRCT